LGKKEGRKKTAPSGKSTLDEVLAGGRPLNVLLVDDNEDNRMLILSYLKKSPYKIEVAENGKIAVDKIQAGAHYDVIFMDMQMPVMDGITATQQIRAWEASHGKPRVTILALTANALKDEVGRCLEAGCDAHVAKPIKKMVLLKALIEHTDYKPQL
jgi:CheY-like chemotaxis protein